MFFPEPLGSSLSDPSLSRGPGSPLSRSKPTYPWRDTPRTLPGLARQWALPDGFHVLSARRVEDVVRVSERYGVTFTRDERTGDIVHPGLVFLVDADGRLAYTFSTPSPAWVREALRRLGRPHVLAG